MELIVRGRHRGLGEVRALQRLGKLGCALAIPRLANLLISKDKSLHLGDFHLTPTALETFR